MILKKSQTSTEFILVSGILAVMMLVFIGIASNQVNDYQTEREYILLNDIAYYIQKEIFLASLSEDGYTRTFELPDKLDFKYYYNISVIDKKFLVVSSNSTSITLTIPEISGNIDKSENTITKSGGVIDIS